MAGAKKSTHARAKSADVRIAVERDDLDAILYHLQYVRQQLMKLDPDALGDTDHESWREQLNAVSLAIASVRSARLGALDDEFRVESGALEKAIGEVAGDLYREQQAAQIVGIVAGGIGTVARIVALLA